MQRYPTQRGFEDVDPDSGETGSARGERGALVEGQRKVTTEDLAHLLDLLRADDDGMNAFKNPRFPED